MLPCPISNPPLNIAYIYIYISRMAGEVDSQIRFYSPLGKYTLRVYLTQKHTSLGIYLKPRFEYTRGRRVTSHELTLPKKKTHTAQEEVYIYFSVPRRNDQSARDEPSSSSLSSSSYHIVQTYAICIAHISITAMRCAHGMAADAAGSGFMGYQHTTISLCAEWRNVYIHHHTHGQTR